MDSFRRAAGLVALCGGGPCTRVPGALRRLVLAFDGCQRTDAGEPDGLMQATLRANGSQFSPVSLSSPRSLLLLLWRTM